MSSIYADKSEYAISSWTLEDLDLKSALEAIARNGFSSVELWADNVHFDPRLGLDRKLVSKWLGDLGLTVHSVHSPFRKFPSYANADEFRKIRQDLWCRTIDDCSELGVPIMVVHGLDRKEYNYRTDQLRVVGDSLSGLCEFGRKKGVMIALENIPGSGKDSVEIPCRLQDHVAHFPGIGLKYCLDIGHALLSGADVFDEIDAVGKDLVTLHVHNNHGDEDSHDLPDDGLLDWPAIHSYLRDGRYDGQFVMEVYGTGAPLQTIQRVAALFA